MSRSPSPRRFTAGSSINDHADILRNALVQSVTEENMAEIAQQIVAAAVKGNLTAARLLLQYVVGKPKCNHGEHGGHGEVPIEARDEPTPQRPNQKKEDEFVVTAFTRSEEPRTDGEKSNHGGHGEVPIEAPGELKLHRQNEKKEDEFVVNAFRRSDGSRTDGEKGNHGRHEELPTEALRAPTVQVREAEPSKSRNEKNRPRPPGSGVPSPNYCERLRLALMSGYGIPEPA